MSESLHPDVKKFKSFVRKNPHVLRDVNSGEKSLQDLFEEWMLFGEDDEIWETYRTDDEQSNNDTDTSSSSNNTEDSNEDNKDDTEEETDFLNMIKKMNLNDVQHHLTQFSTVVGSIQELVNQFRQQSNSSTPPAPSQENQAPFGFRED